MELKDVTIRQATIDIKVIRVDGKQMTKAVFRQIEGPAYFFNEPDQYNANVKTVVGWVKDGRDYLLYLNHQGQLRKVSFGYWSLIQHLLEERKDQWEQLFIAV